MPGVGFEPMTPVFEQAKIVPVLDLCGHSDWHYILYINADIKIQMEALFSIYKERICKIRVF
jgi:hypothetical protein